jgi:hypothetical protein
LCRGNSNAGTERRQYRANQDGASQVSRHSFCPSPTTPRLNNERAAAPPVADGSQPHRHAHGRDANGLLASSAGQAPSGWRAKEPAQGRAASPVVFLKYFSRYFGSGGG